MEAASKKKAFEERLVSIKEVVRLTGLSRSTILRHERDGIFVKRRKVGPKRVAFRLSEVVAWMENCPVVGEKGA
jgi:prophage regulatory protein